MSWIQRFFLWIMPRSIGSAIEAQSRRWMRRCSACGGDVSVWDAGGIRYLAAGSPRRIGYCPLCKHMTWYQLEKRPANQAAISSH